MFSCELKFGLGWKDIANAGQLVFSINQGDKIKAQAQFGSIGAARKLYAFDGEFISVIDGKTLQPVGFEQTDKYPDESDIYALEFDGEKVVVAHDTKDHKSDKVVKRKRDWKIKNAFDLLSASLFMRSQPLAKEGESYTFVVFPNDTPYLVTATYVGKAKRSNGTEEVDALKLDLNIQKIDPKMKLSPLNEKIKSTSIFFSADDQRIPLGVSASLVASSVEVNLLEVSKK